MRIVTDIYSSCRDHLPKWNTISISGYHIREAGSTAVQEVAFTLADGIAYVQAALDAGLRVDEFAPQLSFFFNAHNDLLEEIAKYRAARRLWAKIMVERFGAKDPRSLMLRFHAQTAGSSLTAQQPENNIVRVAIQALAAVRGGNDFVAPSTGENEDRAIPILRIDAEIERSQIARLNALRAKRDSARAQSALAELQRIAATSENLIPAILAAVEAYATVGEISDALRRVFGEYQESVVI